MRNNDISTYGHIIIPMLFGRNCPFVDAFNKTVDTLSDVVMISSFENGKNIRKCSSQSEGTFIESAQSIIQ